MPKLLAKIGGAIKLDGFGICCRILTTHAKAAQPGLSSLYACMQRLRHIGKILFERHIPEQGETDEFLVGIQHCCINLNVIHNIYGWFFIGQV